MRIRAFGILVFLILTAVAIEPPCQARTTSDAVATVRVFVEPFVFVSHTVTVQAQIEQGSNRAGEIKIDTVFDVKSNSNRVAMYVTATDLYKNGLAGGDVEAIPLKLSDGVKIDSTSSQVRGGGSNIVSFDGELTFDGLPARRTNVLELVSDQKGRFVQDVIVTVTWLQNDPKKPAGIYIGKVKLVAFLLPD